MSHPGIMKKIYSESKKYRTFIDSMFYILLIKTPFIMTKYNLFFF